MTGLKTVEQLDITATKIGSASWGGQSTGIGSVMGSTWSQKIIFDAQPDRVLSKYFLEFNDLMNNNDVTIVIPKIGDVNLMGGRSGNEEGKTRVMTNFDTANNLTVSLTSADVKLGGCAISFETASATRVSIVEMAHQQLVRQYLETIETDANAILEGATIGSTGASGVYGGDATSTATLETGDVITVDKVIDMKIELQKKNFAKKPGQGVMFVAPEQYKQLLKSSQFTNAAEFGSNTVVTKGVIEEYVGVMIEVSTLVTAATTWGSGSLAGHYVYVIDPSAAAGIVWKEKAKVKVVTEDDERVHKVLLDAWYKMTRINEQAICLGHFSDA
jgi:N4-gp56 family major capsid protein